MTHLDKLRRAVELADDLAEITEDLFDQCACSAPDWVERAAREIGMALRKRLEVTEKALLSEQKKAAERTMQGHPAASA